MAQIGRRGRFFNLRKMMHGWKGSKYGWECDARIRKAENAGCSCLGREFLDLNAAIPQALPMWNLTKVIMNLLLLLKTKKVSQRLILFW